MQKIAIFFATGYEEIEALTVVDICRRCGLQIDMISITKERCVTGSHNITVTMDYCYEEIDFDTYDMLVLPGGGVGVEGLEAHADLVKQIQTFDRAGKYIAAVCAAPSILGHLGILKGKKACSYPSFESHLEGADVTKESFAIADHIITSRGMGTAIDFALAIVSVLKDDKTAADMAKKIVYQQ